MSALNPYLTEFSYAGIGQTGNIPVVPDSTTGFTSADIGKPLAYGTDGFKVAGDGDVILGFLIAFDEGTGYGTLATKGFFLAETAAAITPGTFVKGAASGTVQAVATDATSGAYVDLSKALVVAPYDSTHVWVELL